MGDPDNGSVSPGKALFLIGMLAGLGLLIYLMAGDIKKLPPGTPVAAAPAASPARQIPLGFRVGGRIDRMYFAAQAPVKKGDVLASLDKTPFAEALMRARVELRAAQEGGAGTHIPTGNFTAIETARAHVEAAQHAYDVAHAELLKEKAMLAPGKLDNVYADDVQNDRDAGLNLERARRALAQQQDALGVGAPDRAAVQAAEANVAIAETNLADTQLVAPADGVIASRNAEPGAVVAADTPVYILAVSPGAALTRR